MIRSYKDVLFEDVAERRAIYGNVTVFTYRMSLYNQSLVPRLALALFDLVHIGTLAGTSILKSGSSYLHQK